jgi:hypothetical protein
LRFRCGYALERERREVKARMEAEVCILTVVEKGEYGKDQKIIM